MSARYDSGLDGFTYNGTLFDQSVWTLVVWIYLLAGTTSHVPVALRTGSTDGSVNRGFWSDGNNAFRCEVSSISSSYGAALAQGLHFFAFTANGSDNRLWIDDLNTPYAQLTQAPASDTGSPIFAAGGDLASAQLNSRWNGMRIWSGVVLSGKELLAEKRQLKAVRKADLWGEYVMNVAGAGNRGADTSGNGRNLTENGTLADEENAPIHPEWTFLFDRVNQQRNPVFNRRLLRVR